MAVLGCVAPSNMGDVARRVAEVENLVDFGMVAAGVVLEQNRSRTDCEGRKADSAVLGHYTSLVQMASCVILKVIYLQEWVHSAGKLAPGQRVGVGQVQHRAAAVPALLEPPISTAEIAVLLAYKLPSHPQMSCVILVVITDQRASRVLYRQAATGERRVNAPALSEGATD
jgi:hypothetical protein